jgi:toxin ParE1/3/4
VRVRWLRQALANLEAEAQYISRDSAIAAGHVVLAIQTAVTRLADHPPIGRPGRVAGTRELIILGTPYVIPYRIRGDQVEILRVFHGARRWPKNL